MSLLQSTRVLAASVLKYANKGQLFKFVVGTDQAQNLIDELRVASKDPTTPGLHTLTKLHGYPVEVGGPPDEIRFMAIEEDDD